MPRRARHCGRISETVKAGAYTPAVYPGGKGYDVAVAQLDDGRKLLIVPKTRMDESVSQMVDSSLAEFDNLKDKQVTVRQVGFLTLGVLTFLLIFASTWTAFYIARGITVPIKRLAEGADEIAKGNLSHRVSVLAEDELALLVTAFNEMSTTLEANSSELTVRRRYIETVLLSLPTGVISVDAENRITTINPAAKLILRLEPGDFSGVQLDSLIAAEDRVAIGRLVARAKRIGTASDQTKLRVATSDGNLAGVLPVALIATALPSEAGAVLVIEDLSELIDAQRASAWQEVARRMAHEIKNPLTPIQLSAERIAKNFADSRIAVATGIGGNLAIDNKSEKVVREGTETILREVMSLKSMVDEFAKFARLPSVRLEAHDVNESIVQAADLYRDRTSEIRTLLDLASGLPSVMVDDEQVKRVLVNLIDNAIEASGAAGGREVKISSRHDLARDIVVVEVSDNGDGIDPADFQKLFQPYFSTKGRGTGLGLAIVHRIIAEHRGKIKAVPNQPNGAKFIIELPVAA